jgi:uncharacterized protein (DUF1778 family)
LTRTPRVQMAFRADAGRLALISAAAEKLGVSRGQFIVDAAVARAVQVLGEEYAAAILQAA